MKRQIIKVVGLVLVCCGFAAMDAAAVFAEPYQSNQARDENPSEQDEALAAMKRGEIMGYAKIRRRAETRLGGQLVGARLRMTGRGWVYEVKVRKKGGRVVFAILDAKSGRQIKAKR